MTTIAAPTLAPNVMRPGGYYIGTDGTAHDANGKPIPCDICDRYMARPELVYIEGLPFVVGPCCRGAIAEMPTALFVQARPPRELAPFGSSMSDLP